MRNRQHQHSEARADVLDELSSNRLIFDHDQLRESLVSGTEQSDAERLAGWVVAQAVQDAVEALSPKHRCPALAQRIVRARVNGRRRPEAPARRAGEIRQPDARPETDEREPATGNFEVQGARG